MYSVPQRFFYNAYGNAPGPHLKRKIGTIHERAGSRQEWYDHLLHINLTTMTSHEILQADMLDIVFDNRNKQYGAYVLRKHYNARLMQSLGMALGGVLFLFFLISGPGKVSDILSTPKEGKVVSMSDVKIPPKKIIPVAPAPPSAPRPPVATAQFTPYRITEIVKVPQTPMPNADFGKVAISDVTTTGVSGPPAVDPGPSPSSNGTAVDPPTDAKPDVVQREPEFPGGAAAWNAFLQKNLQVPDQLEVGEKKTVMIRFQVSPEGSVTGFEVVQTAGKRYDEEVIRVLRKMPKWKPAIKDNLPVARYFTQPVTFMGVEE